METSCYLCTHEGEHMLNKTELLRIALKTEEVKLDQGSLKIQEFTTSDREAFEIFAMKMNTGKVKNLKAKLIVISVVEDRGSRMFGDDEIGTVSQLPSTITEKLFNAILKLNGMGAASFSEAEGN